MYAERRSAATAILDALGCTYAPNQAGLFVWAKAPDHIADVEPWIDEILYETKVFITPGFIFGNAGKRFIRISLCCTAAKLEEALGRIRKFSRERAVDATKMLKTTK